MVYFFGKQVVLWLSFAAAKCYDFFKKGIL